jgi:hypothetical protein
MKKYLKLLSLYLGAGIMIYFVISGVYVGIGRCPLIVNQNEYGTVISYRNNPTPPVVYQASNDQEFFCMPYRIYLELSTCRGLCEYEYTETLVAPKS